MKTWLQLFILFAVVLLATPPLHASIITFGLDNTQTVKGIKSTGTYDLVDIYAAPGGFGVAFLLPPVPLEVPRGGITGGLIDFRARLTNSFMAPAWTFPTAAADLANNSLVITSYDVHGDAFYVGIEDTPTRSGFGVHLATPPAGNVHWIQVIRNNHELAGAGVHGTPSNKVDNNGGAANPYYDVPFTANATDFLDSPTRVDPTNSHFWLADLYPVTGPAGNAAGAVTVYNGIRWGWVNLFFNVPNVFGIAQAFEDMTTVAALSDTFGVDFSELIMLEQLELVDAEFEQEFATIPEPTTLLLLGTGLVGLLGYSWRRQQHA